MNVAITRIHERLEKLEEGNSVPDFVQITFDKIFCDLRRLREQCAALEAEIAAAPQAAGSG